MGLEPTFQYLDITAPNITRVTYRVTELICLDFYELCVTNIKLFVQIDEKFGYGNIMNHM